MSSVSSASPMQSHTSSGRRRFTREVRRHVLACLLLAPLVLILVAFLAIPFISLFYLALQKIDFSGTSTFVGLDNYRILFNESRFIQNIVASIQYLVGVLVISIPIAYFAAILISSNI